MASASAIAAGTTETDRRPADASAVTGYIVLLHETATAATVDERRGRLAAVVGEARLPLAVGERVTGRWVRASLPAAVAGSDAAGLEARLRADPRVAAVVPDVREQRLAVTPNDPLFVEQWWLQPRPASGWGVAGFAEAWALSTGAPVSGTGAPVAVLDSGITSHPELNSRVLPGWDFVSDPIYAGDGNGRDNDPSDPGDAITDAARLANPVAFDQCPPQPVSSWHGTLIAGQIAAVTNNGEGVAAANWNGTVLPVRVAGLCGAAVSDIIDGLRWAAGLPVPGVPSNPNPARIIVLGYGSIDPCDTDHAVLAVRDTARLYEAALAEVRAEGAIVFAAAGNQRRSSVSRPASCRGAFAVTSLNRDGFKASYANVGPEIRLATPGGDAEVGGTCDRQLADSGIVSTANLGDVAPGAPGYAAASGTSFASPAVAATAAMMLAVNPALTVVQVENGLVASAAPFPQVPLLGECANDNRGRCTCNGLTCGAGLLDAAEALRFAADPDGYTASLRESPALRDDRIEACAALLGRPVPPPDPPAPPQPPNPPADPGGGGTGGGAMGSGWLIALAAAVWLVRRSGTLSSWPSAR